MFRMLSISLVNDSELHDQSQFEDPVCGSGLHGRRHTLMLPAHSPILTISTHAACGNLICGLTLGFTSWNVAPSEGKREQYRLAFEEIINN